MFTDKKLTEAYKKAKIQNFDKSSKYIFFSDCHRGDDSVSDEFTRNQSVFLCALDYYFNNGYIYVEAGDGDELWEYKRFKYIRLAHCDIFSSLKKFYDDKRMIMLYGNHNIFLKKRHYVKRNYYNFYEEYEQDYYKLFPGMKPHEALVLREKDTKQEILIVHGHQGDLLNDQLWTINMLVLRYFWRFMHVVGFQNPSSPARNQFKRNRIEKNYKKWIQNHRLMLICGHTHRPKFPKEGELPYFNTGCCTRTRGINGIEILNGEIMMIDWRIKTNGDGTLQVKRTVMRGPEPIEKYNLKKHPSQRSSHK